MPFGTFKGRYPILLLLPTWFSPCMFSLKTAEGAPLRCSLKHTKCHPTERTCEQATRDGIYRLVSCCIIHWGKLTGSIGWYFLVVPTVLTDFILVHLHSAVPGHPRVFRRVLLLHGYAYPRRLRHPSARHTRLVLLRLLPLVRRPRAHPLSRGKW